MKKVLLDIIWGELFPSLFVCFFKKITSTKKKVESLVIAEHVTVSNFQRISEEFDLLEKFKLHMDDETSVDVVFQEEKFLEALYTNPNLYMKVGKEFCVIFDIFYAKTGTKAVVESFYRVVKSQEQDGEQKLLTLA